MPHHKLYLSKLQLVEDMDSLSSIPNGKILINTINAHSFNTAQKDQLFAEALTNSDYLIPDGGSIVLACRFLAHSTSKPKERISGWDLFSYEMSRLEIASKESVRLLGKMKTVMFMGSSERVLRLIKKRSAVDYPHLNVATYSPPFKEQFSDDDNFQLIQAINNTRPDLLWIGMTAPKQEKWAYSHWDELEITCHVGTIGAVFDFFSGTAKRAPVWWQRHYLEWLYRLIKEPRRLWRRYIIGNFVFLWYFAIEKFRI